MTFFCRTRDTTVDPALQLMQGVLFPEAGSSNENSVGRVASTATTQSEIAQLAAKSARRKAMDVEEFIMRERARTAALRLKERHSNSEAEEVPEVAQADAGPRSEVSTCSDRDCGKKIRPPCCIAAIHA